MITVICPLTESPQTLGERQRVSSHRSRAGTVTYYRCGCGELVLDSPQGRHHVRPSVAVPAS